MTYKQIEASREIRLWIGQIVVPAAAATALVLSNPGVRQSLSNLFCNVKQSVTNKFQRY